MAKSEQERADADHHAGHQRRHDQVPAAHRRQVKSHVTAQPVKNNVAEVHVAGVADHQVQVAGQDDGDGDEDKIFAQGNVVAAQWSVDEAGGDKQNDPEGGPAQDHAAALLPKMPWGNATRHDHEQPELDQRNPADGDERRDHSLQQSQKNSGDQGSERLAQSRQNGHHETF